MTALNSTLTQARLKEVLHYNPDTGAFTRIVSEHQPTRWVGKLAGFMNDQGYWLVGIDHHNYRAHRLAFLYVEGAFPPSQVDHINHIRDDNRWCNLRHATNRINHKNVSRQSNNTSDTCGVHWHKQYKHWEVYINVLGVRIRGGYFKSKQQAITVRKQLEVEHGFHANHGAS